MKSINISNRMKHFILLCAFTMILPLSMNAQKSRGGGGKSKARTAAPARSSVSKPATSPKNVKGGNEKTKSVKESAPKTESKKSDSTKKSAKNKSDNKNSGNTVNIDNSKNIKVSNNKNTRVRSSSRPYNRPPYRYGGRRYYCHHPYYYHPYRPFYWGPYWYPWGYHTTTIVETVTVVNVSSIEYYYDQGVFYIKSGDGYTVIQAPIGATVKSLPKEKMEVKVSDTTTNYYYGGAFYEKSGEGYTVVSATAGTIVPSLPEGGEATKIGEVTYVVFGDTYYQPIEVDGKDMYEIVEVKVD
jgi:hypothetical protein